MKNKKGDGLTLNTIVVATLVLIVLFVMIFMIYKYIVKGTNEGLDPITADSAKRACCASQCIGSPPTNDCSKILGSTTCDCTLTLPGQTQKAAATT